MKALFSGKNLEECLEAAENELGIPKNEIKYSIAKKRGIFSKNFVIEVEANQAFDKFTSKSKGRKNIMKDTGDITLPEDLDTSYETAEEETGSTLENTYKKPSDKTEESSEGIIVKDKKIKVVSEDENKKFEIRGCSGIKLFINGNVCEKGKSYTVTSKDKITYTAKEEEYKRECTITAADNKMSASAHFNYSPALKYELSDTEYPQERLSLKAKKTILEMPKRYSIAEISESLKNLKIVHGILIEKIHEASLSDEEDFVMTVAEGTYPVDDVEDEIKIYFNHAKSTEHTEENINERIDYRNQNSITIVNEGDVIAEKIPGHSGSDGMDIYGKEIKRKIARGKIIRADKGCRLSENKIIAAKTGEPKEINGLFRVEGTYSIKQVNMESGNINFQGNVHVEDSIEEGMKVNCTGDLIVDGNIASAKIQAGSGLEVKKNIISSNIMAGGYDAEKSIYIEHLKEFYNNFDAIVLSVKKILDINQDKKIGEIFKVLVENKYKSLPKESMEIICYNLTQGIKNSEILDFIRNKIMGMNSYKIADLKELEHFRNVIKDEIEYIGDSCEIPADVTVNYVQNSTIVSTGKIILRGSGSYISTLRAMDSIECTENNAVIRGGELIAKNSLKLSKVGSDAGIVTSLKVGEKGIIEAKVIYTGTVLKFGNKEKKVPKSGKNMKAFVAPNGTIEIEMISL